MWFSQKAMESIPRELNSNIERSSVRGVWRALIHFQINVALITRRTGLIWGWIDLLLRRSSYFSRKSQFYLYPLTITVSKGFKVHIFMSIPNAIPPKGKKYLNLEKERRVGEPSFQGAICALIDSHNTFYIKGVIHKWEAAQTIVPYFWWAEKLLDWRKTVGWRGDVSSRLKPEMTRFRQQLLDTVFQVPWL